MIDLTSEYLMPFNIAVAVILLIGVWRGVTKGFFRELVELAGGVVSFYVSWRFSIVLARHISVFSSIRTGYELADNLAQAYKHYINQICWFIILFIVLQIGFALIIHMLEGTEKLPVIKQASKICGAVLGMLESAVWIFVICVLLNTPVFKNGSAFVHDSWVGMAMDLPVVQDTVKPMLNSETFLTMAENVDELTKKEEDNLDKWLKENGYDGISLYK